MPAKSLRSMINSTLLLSLLLVAGLAVGANVMQPASAQTAHPGNAYIVTTTNDSGSGSLRQAIIDANGIQGWTLFPSIFQDQAYVPSRPPPPSLP